MARTTTSPVQTLPYPYEVVFDGVLAVLPRMPATISGADRTTGIVTATTATSWRSWGEALTVTVGQDQPGTTSVTLRSQASFQLVDWGKNTKNIDFFTTALRSYVDHTFGHLRTDGPPPGP